MSGTQDVHAVAVVMHGAHGHVHLAHEPETYVNPEIHVVQVSGFAQTAQNSLHIPAEAIAVTSAMDRHFVM